MYSSVDQIAVATYLANKSVERALSSKLEDARDAVTNKVADILTAYKNSMTGGGGGGQLATADNMKMLPVLALGLLKHVSPEFSFLEGLINTDWCAWV
jgi:protein transport protein SEC24